MTQPFATSPVTQVYSCFHYAYALGNQNNTTVAFGLSIAPPGIIAQSPGVNWVSAGGAALFRTNTAPRTTDPDAPFVPLVCLSSLRDGQAVDDLGHRTGHPGDPGSDKSLPNLPLPWGPLDDDGEEQEEFMDDLAGSS
jgi:hypothetical protein